MNELPDSYIRERVSIENGPFWFAWIISAHSSPDFEETTYLGALVTRAKYHDDRAALVEIETAVRHSVLQLRAVPIGKQGLASVTGVIAVPCNPTKGISLPHQVAAVAALTLGVPDLSHIATKRRPSSPAKFDSRLSPENYRVDRDLAGQRILVVDDVFRTGNTLESVAINLRGANVEDLVGLCLTKARKGMTRGA